MFYLKFYQMKKFNLLFVLLLFGTAVMAQTELLNGQHKGYIVTKDGKKDGIIWMDGADSQPWANQKNIKFLTEDAFSKITKNKAKYFEEFSSKEILGYGFDANEYEAVKYADMSAVGPDMLAKMYFLKVLTKGNISVYIYYRTPPSIVSGSDVNKTDEEWAQDNDIVIKKGNEKAKSTESIELVDLISDCPTVKDKYLNGDYGFKPENDGSKSGMKKIWAKMGDRAKIAEAVVYIAKDYNACNK
jgi:hypothetical protein